MGAHQNNIKQEIKQNIDQKVGCVFVASQAKFRKFA